MLVVGVSVLECVGESTVCTLERLANLVCGAQMEVQISAAVEALMANIALALRNKQKDYHYSHTRAVQYLHDCGMTS